MKRIIYFILIVGVIFGLISKTTPTPSPVVPTFKPSVTVDSTSMRDAYMGGCTSVEVEGWTVYEKQSFCSCTYDYIVNEVGINNAISFEKGSDGYNQVVNDATDYCSR